MLEQSEVQLCNFPMKTSSFKSNGKATKLLLIVTVGALLYVLYKLQYYDETEMSKIVGLDFEVYGRVQGVFFRKYTQKRAQQLSLKGWCMNTERRTVTGRLEGEKSKVEEMKHWLQYTGSPQSMIEKAEFRNVKELPNTTFTDFKIKK